MMQNSNKSAYLFLLVLDFILRNKCFSINEIILYLHQTFSITVKTKTIFKYMRTLRFLGFKFSKPKNDVYSLIQLPFAKEAVCNENQLLKSIEILKKNPLSDDFEVNEDLIYKLNLFLFNDKKYTENKKNIIVNTKTKQTKSFLKKIKLCCEEGLRLRITYKKTDNKDAVLFVEPISILTKNDNNYLKAINIAQKRSILLNVNSIVQIEKTLIKNKYTANKYSVTLKFLDKVAKSYTLKEEEEIIEKQKEYIIVKSFYYEKKTFFNNILRYMENVEILTPKRLRTEFQRYLKDLYQKYDCPNVK